MAMTVQEIINQADRKYPNAVSDDDKVKVLDNLQKQWFRTFHKKKTSTAWDIAADQFLYPIDFHPSKIISVLVKEDANSDYNELDYENLAPVEEDSPYYYIYEKSIALYPTPEESVDRGLLVFHYEEPNNLTLSSVPDFDGDFHWMLVYALCVDLAEDDQRDDMVNAFTAKFNEWMEKYREAYPEPELPPIRVV